MSLLLDALNKADQERKRNEGTPGINSNHEGYADNHHYRPSLLIIILIALVSVFIAGGIFYWLNTHVEKTSAKEIAAKTAEKKVDAAKPKSAAAASSATSSVASESSANDEEQNTVAEEPTDETVASLYQQQNAIAVVNAQARQPATLPAPPVQQPVQQSLPQTQPTDVASPPAQTSINQFANLPYIQDLPRGILDKLPTLKYEQHNFNGTTGSVVINGVVRHADDQLGNGLVIDKILEDGMILHLDNFSFKIRALNSWVNM